MTLNPEEGRRLHVLSLLERGRITTAQAAEALGITPRQVRRPGPGRRSYARALADVVQCLDGSWRVYVADRLVATTPAPPDPGQLRARKRR